MKIMKKSEWENVPADYKKFFDAIPYILCENTDGSAYFGPVKILDNNSKFQSQKVKIK